MVSGWYFRTHSCLPVFMFCRRSLRSEADMRAVLWRWTRDDGESLRVNWLRGCSNSARIMSLSCSSTKMRWTRLSLQRYITQNLRWCIKVSRFIVLFFLFVLFFCSWISELKFVCIESFFHYSCRMPSRLCWRKMTLRQPPEMNWKPPS